MQVVTIEDDTSTLTLAPGDQVELRLPENAGTGYQWQLDPLDLPLLVVDEALKPAAGQPGATGEHRFLLRAGGPGETSVAARLVRPWDTTQVARQFRLAVRVR
ncbi:MAG TPA: protease inhibitor I42 family protein [Amycolatopsis sp.]